MTSHDVSKLCCSELLDLRKALDPKIAAKRADELTVRADGYVKKMEAAGFSIVEAIQALQPYPGNKSTGKKLGPSTAAVLYRDPSDPSNTWSGRGRAAQWLSTYEVQGRSRDEFRVHNWPPPGGRFAAN